MVKRTWSETEISGSERPSIVAQLQKRPSGHVRNDSSDAEGGQATLVSQVSVPQISRKVKACAACRKQKIKCIMDGGPPCRRCAERNLGCVLNKSLQTLIDEKSQFAAAYSHDLEMVYQSLQDVLKKVGIPQMAPLQSSSSVTLVDQSPSATESPVRPTFNVGPSCDNSPQINPAEEGLSDVPIHSLYALTKLSAFRSPDVGEVEKRPGHASSQQPDDFISKSEIPRETADRLFKLYKERLDHYMYRIGCPYTTLDEVRAKSPILTASICTVAALHDKDSDSVYGICSDEFRRLMGNCMFDRLVKRDSLRAMCIAAYWLSDISWTVSGYAIRRAGDFNLSHSFNRVTAGGGESDADCLRLWYILYICDQHLALLYGRQPIVRDDFSIAGCERFIHSAASTDQDTRLVSQVALLLIFEEMRKLFSQKAEGPLPEEYLGHMVDLEHRMNQWYSTWSSRVKETYAQVGVFPRKGILLHLHFAKLHLYSHVFEGLQDSPIPSHFLPYAKSAAGSARSIVKLLLHDDAIQESLNGIPSYVHSMTAFVCMFLIKVAMKYGQPLVDRAEVTDLISQLVELFRKTRTGKWHLCHLMEGGLEKMLGLLAKCPVTSAATPLPSDNFPFGTLTTTQDATGLGLPDGDFPAASLDGLNFMDYNIGLSPLMQFDHASLGIGDTWHGF